MLHRYGRRVTIVSADLFGYVFGLQTVNRLAPLLALYSAFNGSGSVLAGALKWALLHSLLHHCLLQRCPGFMLLEAGFRNHLKDRISLKFALF